MTPQLDVRDTRYTDSRFRALEVGIKEAYFSVHKQETTTFDKGFADLPSKEKLLIFNTEILKLAKEVGVTLPR